MNVTFTPSFINHARKVIAKSDLPGTDSKDAYPYKGLYIHTKRVGCNGLAYDYTPMMVYQGSDIDEHFIFPDLLILIPKAEAAIFEGCEFDYARQGLNYKVVVNNPNAKASCGCGESFSL